MEEKKNRPFSWLPTVLIIILAIMLLSSMFGNPDKAKEISRDQCTTQVEAGNVAEVRTYGATIYGIYVTHPDPDATKVTADEFEKKGKFDFYLNCGYASEAL
ncbi:MAG: hypothetical protein IKC79_00440, partial [Clostridia bacterium]|nr:hypothetical protein [Clostridia bacterium]